MRNCFGGDFEELAQMLTVFAAAETVGSERRQARSDPGREARHKADLSGRRAWERHADAARDHRLAGMSPEGRRAALGATALAKELQSSQRRPANLPGAGTPGKRPVKVPVGKKVTTFKPSSTTLRALTAGLGNP